MWGTRIRRGTTTIAFALLLAAGCGGEERPPGEVALAPTGARLDGHRWLGEPLVLGNLEVWPVFTDRPLDVGEFLTLPEAEQREVAEVREVGGGAEVNTLVVENRGDLPILVCAGTIVKGGQQDRQIAQDLVVAARTTVPVDAFCVEPGRWVARAGRGLELSSLGQGVAPRSVRASGQYERDQGKVWEEVHKVLAESDIDGTTTLVAATEQAAGETIARREAAERRIVEHFARLARDGGAPVGFAYAVDGKPVTVRAFAHERLLRGQLPAFAKAMCLEAELSERARGGAPAPAPATAADVVAMVRSLAGADARRHETSGANANLYRISDAAFGGACLMEHRDAEPQVLTEDWTAR